MLKYLVLFQVPFIKKLMLKLTFKLFLMDLDANIFSNLVPFQCFIFKSIITNLLIKETFLSNHNEIVIHKQIIRGLNSHIIFMD